MSLSAYEQTLLTGWEDVFKKGNLTFWIMLALKDSPKHMAEIKSFITDTTGGTISADDQSMYRALRRFNDAQLVTYVTAPSESGPDLKIYKISHIGRNILQLFIERNIIGPYFNERMIQLLNN